VEVGEARVEVETDVRVVMRRHGGGRRMGMGQILRRTEGRR